MNAPAPGRPLAGPCRPGARWRVARPFWATLAGEARKARLRPGEEDYLELGEDYVVRLVEPLARGITMRASTSITLLEIDMLLDCGMIEQM